MSTTAISPVAADIALIAEPIAGPYYANPAIAYLENLKDGPGRDNKRTELRRLAFAMWGESLETAQWGSLSAANMHWVRGQMRGVKTLKANTINAYLAALKGVAKMAFDMHQMSADECLRIHHIKRVPLNDQEHCEAPPSAWVNGFVQYAKDRCGYGLDGVLAKRLLAILGMLPGMGLRREEATTILFKDIKDRRYKVMGKGDKVATLCMTQLAIDCITPWRHTVEYYANAHGKDTDSIPMLFRVGKGGDMRVGERLTPQGLDYIFNRAQEDAVFKGYIPASAPHYSPHDLRAFFITTIISQTRDLSAAQKLARHANIETTTTYDTRAETRANDIARRVDLLAKEESDEPN